VTIAGQPEWHQPGEEFWLDDHGGEDGNREGRHPPVRRLVERFQPHEITTVIEIDDDRSPDADDAA